MSIRISGLTKKFDNFVALNDVSLDVPSGELLALLGPSGSGKTTLLRIIAGLESADSGTVKYEGEDVTHVAPKDRQVGFVFQHYALFRHLSVFENVAFGLRIRKTPNAEVTKRVRELLHLVRLEGLEHRYPSQLSGGQRQRVALARALAVPPRMLLLDEPFGALDAKVRQELRQWLRHLHDEMHVTTVFVTHDQEEAFEVADHVVVMRAGKIEQSGSPQDVFDHPANPFVMDFLGQVNVFHGRLQAGQVHLGGMAVEYPDYPHAESRDTMAYIRPHEVELHRLPVNGSSLRVKVQHVNPAGAVTRVRVSSEVFGVSLNVDLRPDRYAELGLRPGDEVYAVPKRVRVFMPDDYVI
ncbi:MAG: sulfate/molybdate ABC transporter ATP-binding protein [Planctomycetaceae bacterium]|nr:sulfate/molybdate ABC transporter ATP-binding protein [Planctomycetaceae bacterium]